MYICGSHTQLPEKSWNRKEELPAEDLDNESENSLTNSAGADRSLACSGGGPEALLSDGESERSRSSSVEDGNSLAGSKIAGGAGDGSTDKNVDPVLRRDPPCGDRDSRSQTRKWRRIGFSAWRCKESLRLMEAVSKQRIAPEEDTIQGRTFSLETLEITRRFPILVVSLYRSVRPDLAAGETLFSSSSLATELTKMKP